MAFRSPLFRKLLLTALLLVLVTLAGADILLTRYTAARELAHAVQELDGMIRVLTPRLSSVEPVLLGVWVKTEDARTGARVTVIDRHGVVLADSRNDPSTMENHAGRPEIREALAGHKQSSVRHSATMDVDFCYLAAPADLPGQAGAVLRLAMPLAQVSVSIAEVRWLILKSSLLGAFLALVTAWVLSRAFTGRIGRIEAYAAELAKGDYAGALVTEADDELSSVARALRHMAQQFRDMLDRLSEEGFERRAILAGMVEGVLAVDSSLHVTFCNDSLAAAIHARTPVPERVPVLHLIRDPDLHQLLEHVLATGGSARRRMNLLAAGGRTFDVQGAPLELRNGRGAIAILHDVTELERLERVRKDFIVNISHELRTPLAAIRGYAETLLDGAAEEPENNRKFLEIIRAHAARLGDVASDLQTLSELEAERETPPAEQISVRQVVETALNGVQEEARGYKVQVLAGNVEDVKIAAPRGRLDRVLLNLLHNAIRFNRPGGEVWVEAAQAGVQVKVVVRDTGVGIAFEDLPRIFERFYRVDKSRSRETGGTGLGLAIVRHTVEKMSGTVTVESTLGKGSEFTVVLPAA
ncbi:MAG TPA: ATP-binding protein [Candidatus Acidoferrales bacterium]|nr:ATP-binding protein [Candidatus Acidoferrales bacterium]